MGASRNSQTGKEWEVKILGSIIADNTQRKLVQSRTQMSGWIFNTIDRHTGEATCRQVPEQPTIFVTALKEQFLKF